MDKKINITVNGQSFEIPIDASLLNGLFGSLRTTNVVTPGMRPPILGVPIETSHQRLEDNFFKLLDNETRTNRAIMALHRRLKVLEDRVMPMPKNIELPFGLGVGPNILAEFGKVLKDDNSRFSEGVFREWIRRRIGGETKPSKLKKPIAKTKAVPKTKEKSTKKPNSK